MNKKRILICILCVIVSVLAIAGLYKLAKHIVWENAISDRGEVNIVVLGDSIWDLVRDETGIDAVLEDKLDCTVYNLAISGTSAAFRNQDDSTGTWNKQSLYPLVQHITGNGETTVSETEEAFQMINSIDYDSVDYFVISYGLNDYFNIIPVDGEDPFDLYTYGGALRSAVSMLKERYPDAKIVLISQTCWHLYSYGKIVADSNDYDFGAGYGTAYVEKVQEIAKEYDCIYVDAYHKMGITRRNGLKYLIDATHLTETGREKYASILADYLIKDYIETNKSN